MREKLENIDEDKKMMKKSESRKSKESRKSSEKPRKRRRFTNQRDVDEEISLNNEKAITDREEMVTSYEKDYMEQLQQNTMVNQKSEKKSAA